MGPLATGGKGPKKSPSIPDIRNIAHWFQNTYDLATLTRPRIKTLVSQRPKLAQRDVTFWRAFVRILGRLGLVRGLSAFTGILSKTDQSRFSFRYFIRGRRQQTPATSRVLYRGKRRSSWQ